MLDLYIKKILLKDRSLFVLTSFTEMYMTHFYTQTVVSQREIEHATKLYKH